MYINRIFVVVILKSLGMQRQETIYTYIIFAVIKEHTTTHYMYICIQAVSARAVSNSTAYFYHEW